MYTNLSADEIFELVLECTRDPFFECEFGLYLQKDGAPMGGPLSCLLSDLFMEDYENGRFKVPLARLANFLSFADRFCKFCKHN